jgi:hypothetical protein
VHRPQRTCRSRPVTRRSTRRTACHALRRPGRCRPRRVRARTPPTRWRPARGHRHVPSTRRVTARCGCGLGWRTTGIPNLRSAVIGGTVDL